MRQETLVAETASPEQRRRYRSMVLPVITGDLDSVVIMHQQGMLGDGCEACMLAAANGQLSIVEYLHRSGCDFTKITEKALLLAAANGRLDVVKFLYAEGCDIRLAGDRAIASAAEKGHLDAVEYLHQLGVDIMACRSIVERLPLRQSHLPVVRYLSTNGVFPEGPRLANLVQAIRERDLAQVRANLVDIDVTRHSAVIASALAETDDNPQLMQLVHEHGVDIRAENNLAFRIAAERGRATLVRYLHQTGADVHALNEDALKSAVIFGHAQIVRYLIENGADVTAVDPETLELARLSGHVRVVNYLANIGLDGIATDRVMIMAMRDELYRSAPVYRPSKLWEFFNEVNMEQLRRGGMGNFKRSVNQNYFNFIPYNLLDPQLLKLARWWLNNLSFSPFRLRVVDPDIVPEDRQLLPVEQRVFAFAHHYRIANILSRKFHVDFGRSIQLTLYRWLVAMLWDFAKAHDKMGLAKQLTEPRLGSPVETYRQGRIISQDLAHSILECNSILGEIGAAMGKRPLRIAEIGAGYGRLGYVLMHAAKCRYMVFDIAPGLYVSQWYLSELFPKKRIFRFRHFDRFEEIADELAQAEIAFFTANQIEMIPDGYFDISINISSLHELRPDQIENMLTQIYRVTHRFVYLKQYKEYCNPYDGLRLFEDSYKVATGWRRRYYRDDPVDSRFFETLIETEAPAAEESAPAAPRYHRDAKPARESDSDEPTVSILLANHNHAEYLPTSLAGICGQTLPASEVIIVDDGSTDDSVAVIEAFAERFPNIKLLKNDRNRGQHYSIQRALLAARGDYVVWAASDDLLLPQFLERSLGMLRSHPEAGLCFSRLSVFVDGTTEVRTFTKRTHGVAFDYGRTPHYISPRQLVATLRRHYVWISGNTVLARRSALIEMGGFERSLRWHADWFAYYVVALRYGACVVPETLALMRERCGTYSGGGIADPTQQSEVLKAILDAIKSPKYRDVFPVFRSCPSLLSLFGKRALIVAQANPRDWGIALQLAVWHSPRLLVKLYGQFRQRLSTWRHRLYRALSAMRSR